MKFKSAMELDSRYEMHISRARTIAFEMAQPGSPVTGTREAIV